MSKVGKNLIFNPVLDQLKDISTDEILYNPEILEDNGWCEITGYYAKKGEWGICSPSCKEVLLNIEDELVISVNERLHHNFL